MVTISGWGPNLERDPVSKAAQAASKVSKRGQIADRVKDLLPARWEANAELGGFRNTVMYLLLMLLFVLLFSLSFLFLIFLLLFCDHSAQNVHRERGRFLPMTSAGGLNSASSPPSTTRLEYSM